MGLINWRERDIILSAGRDSSVPAQLLAGTAIYRFSDILNLNIISWVMGDKDGDDDVETRDEIKVMLQRQRVRVMK